MNLNEDYLDDDDLMASAVSALVNACPGLYHSMPLARLNLRQFELLLEMAGILN